MNVLELNTQNMNQFHSIMKGNCIILFHHPQCGHCIELRPTWEKVKEMNKNSPIHIMEIDAMMLNHINHPIKKSVRGFPQIIRLENGKVMEEFNQIRNVENLNKFINKTKKNKSRKKKPRKKKPRKTKRKKN